MKNTDGSFIGVHVFDMFYVFFSILFSFLYETGVPPAGAKGLTSLSPFSGGWKVSEFLISS